MIFVYNFFTFFLSILLFPYFFFNREKRKDIFERYGYWIIPEGDYIWFHGASVGELQGQISLIEKLKIENKTCKIIGTATSIRGKEFISKYVDHAFLLPFDNFFWLNNATRNIKIKKFIFGETELWPALIADLKNKQTPIYMVNARISDFKINSYKIVEFVIRPLLNSITKIFCIDQKNLENFMSLGCPSDKVTITGNLKFDRSPKYKSIDSQNFKKSLFFNELPIVVLGSIRPGEERFWFPVIKKYIDKYNFIIVPRHLEKISYFIESLKGFSLDFKLQSEIKEPTNGIIILNSFGQLELAYSISTISFVGASLIDGFGGHNPLEPAMYGNIIIMGHFFQNQEDTVSLLISNDAINIVFMEEDIAKVLENPNYNQGEAAKVVSSFFVGKTELVYKEIF